MKGFVPTPPEVVDRMIDRLFEARPPEPDDALLDPGCGDGSFIEGVLRWCRSGGRPLPRILGVELHAGRAEEARRRFSGIPEVTITTRDFLWGPIESFDYIVGNPPYVGITGLDADEKARFRAKYRTAVGRFELYILFWEQALNHLRPGGRLVYITPEKYLTVESARRLRQMLASFSVREVEMLCEDTFTGLTTYPTITTVDNARAAGPTRLTRRDGAVRTVCFRPNGDTLAPDIFGGATPASSAVLLEDLCLRISCGVATGADRLFVRKTSTLNGPLVRYAHPTVSGRQLVPGSDRLAPSDSMLVPYDEDGALIDFDRLNGFGDYLAAHRDRLLRRTCTDYKPWYALHETPPMQDIRRPKILCKDVAEAPQFWVDRDGSIVPRHSVYYLVPRDPAILDSLADYLNGPEARDWLMAHCQRVRKGFIRLQSTVLKKLPVSDHIASSLPASRRATSPSGTTSRSPSARTERPIRHRPSSTSRASPRVHPA